MYTNKFTFSFPLPLQFRFRDFQNFDFYLEISKAKSWPIFIKNSIKNLELSSIVETSLFETNKLNTDDIFNIKMSLHLSLYALSGYNSQIQVEKDALFFKTFFWFFSPSFNLLIEQLLVAAYLKTPNEFKKFFLLFQEIYPLNFNLKRKIREVEYGSVFYIFKKQHLLSIMRVLVKLFNPQLLLINNFNFFSFYKTLLRLTLAKGSFFYINKLLDPIEVTREGSVGFWVSLPLENSKYSFLVPIKKSDYCQQSCLLTSQKKTKTKKNFVSNLITSVSIILTLAFSTPGGNTFVRQVCPVLTTSAGFYQKSLPFAVFNMRNVVGSQAASTSSGNTGNPSRSAFHGFSTPTPNRRTVVANVGVVKTSNFQDTVSVVMDLDHTKLTNETSSFTSLATFSYFNHQTGVSILKEFETITSKLDQSGLQDFETLVNVDGQFVKVRDVLYAFDEHGNFNLNNNNIPLYRNFAAFDRTGRVKPLLSLLDGYENQSTDTPAFQRKVDFLTASIWPVCEAEKNKNVASTVKKNETQETLNMYLTSSSMEELKSKLMHFIKLERRTNKMQSAHFLPKAARRMIKSDCNTHGSLNTHTIINTSTDLNKSNACDFSSASNVSELLTQSVPNFKSDYLQRCRAVGQEYKKAQTPKKDQTFNLIASNFFAQVFEDILYDYRSLAGENFTQEAIEFVSKQEQIKPSYVAALKEEFGLLGACLNQNINNFIGLDTTLKKFFSKSDDNIKGFDPAEVLRCLQNGSLKPANFINDVSVLADQVRSWTGVNCSSVASVEHSVLMQATLASIMLEKFDSKGLDTNFLKDCLLKVHNRSQVEMLEVGAAGAYLKQLSEQGTLFYTTLDTNIFQLDKLIQNCSLIEKGLYKLKDHTMVQTYQKELFDAATALTTIKYDLELSKKNLKKAFVGLFDLNITSDEQNLVLTAKVASFINNNKKLLEDLKKAVLANQNNAEISSEILNAVEALKLGEDFQTGKQVATLLGGSLVRPSGIVKNKNKKGVSDTLLLDYSKESFFIEYVSYSSEELNKHSEEERRRLLSDTSPLTPKLKARLIQSKFETNPLENTALVPLPPAPFFENLPVHLNPNLTLGQLNREMNAPIGPLSYAQMVKWGRGDERSAKNYPKTLHHSLDASAKGAKVRAGSEPFCRPTNAIVPHIKK